MSVTELPVIERSGRRAFEPRELYDALTRSLTTRDVRYDRLSRALYATDASVYQLVPMMVAFPATADDVSAAVRVCTIRCTDHSSGRRYVTGGPVDRFRGDSRLLEALQSRARDQSVQPLGSRRTGMCARRSEPCAQTTQPPVHGCLDFKPGDDWRNDRQ